MLDAHEPTVVRLSDLVGRVSGAVAHDDHLVVGIPKPLQVPQAFGQGSLAVSRADDRRHPGPSTITGEGHLAKGVANGMERRLRTPLAVDHTEIPVEDICSSPMPFIGP